jgi:uncharacterized protein YfaS (alpha-2-macroglobulin family)
MKIRNKLMMMSLAAALLALGCAPSGKAAADPDPQLVAAFSGGVVERYGPVTVEFTRDFDVSAPVPQDAFRLEPAAKGTLSWRNSFTLDFTPLQPLRPGKAYTAYVNPAKLKLAEAEAPASEAAASVEAAASAETALPPEAVSPLAYEVFSFAFTASISTLEIDLDPVRIDESGMAVISGLALAERGAPSGLIEKTVQSSVLGKASWSHEGDVHRFRFAPLAREAGERMVQITWDGGALESKDRGSVQVAIPGTASFKLLKIQAREGFIELTFSAALKPNQDLRGFINLSTGTELRYSIDSNLVRVYGEPGAGIPDGAVLTVQDLSDAEGNVLAEPVQFTYAGKWELPEARFAGRGTILPTSQGAQMVIETKNLSGILVEAFRIYGDNMIQFLQVNAVDGGKELERVGEPVWTREFDLRWKEGDKNAWKRHGLDLSELARKYPDGMFHLRLSFRPRHVKYVCEAGHDDFSVMSFPDDTFPSFGREREGSYWTWWEENYTWDWYEYRKDPCHPAYYVKFYDHNITVGRNALVSDLGLLAKRGLDGSWFVAASNLKTAKPEGGVNIDVLNFQGRSLFKLKTDSAGLAQFAAHIPASFNPASAPAAGASASEPGNQVPAFIAASGSLGRAYLRIGDGQSLTVSHFDIAGEKPASGLRGLIYGERGVWRPGDDIFLTFLLADPAKTLPANHPVSFELEDPRGRIGAQKIFTSSVDGFYPITASTQADAPTGDWTARVKVGGSVFTRNLKIETVIPNRLRMDLDFGAKPYIVPKNPTALEAAWLYGAPAPGLSADISVTFSEKSGVFPGNGDYVFTDPSRAVSGERQNVWRGTLDGAGRAAFTMELNPGAAVPGKLNARFMTRVFEPSGAFSSEQITKEFSPYPRYVGLRLPKGDAARNMLLTDTEHQADILLLDADGKPVNGAAQLDCAVYKLEWRWWWEKGENEAAEFESLLSRTPVAQGTVSARNGKASWKFQVKYPEWGRYLVVVRDAEGGHSAASVVYIDWPGWAGRATEGEGQGAAAMLVLSPDKPQYNTGDKVSVSFPSNQEAAALVVVEKGGAVIKKEWIRCQDTLTRYEFSTDSSMVPNVYVHVTLLQPHLQTQNDLPLRLYGITPVMVDDSKTNLTPLITAPDNWEPETEVSFTVSEASGRPMAYTVAVVDEGLLGLTRYSLPAPRNTFYAREASFVKSWDLFADVMGAYSGQLETLLAIGGSDDGTADGGRETQRFKPVVRYFGPYEIKAGEKRTERFTLPPYIGALRIMALAASSTNEAGNRAYGTAEKQVKVSSDLMVFGTVPRVLSTNDEAIIPVTIASYREGARNVEVRMAVSGAALQGSGTQNVSFDKTGEKTVQFRIKAPAAPGKVSFSISAASPGLKNARHATDLAVRTTALPVTVTQTKLIAPNETWSFNVNFPGLAGTNAASAEFSRLPPLNLEGRLESLITYPHGCVEQTTSAAFPQLYLDKALELNAERLGQIRKNVNAAIERLASFQVPDGGFAYWPGGESADDWASSYAGHFLLEAKRAGYAVPANLLGGFTGFQKTRASLWASRDGNQAEQAYRLYTLALAGEADLGSMNRLRERLAAAEQPGPARWRLAAAYWYAGQRDAARNLAASRPAAAEYREYGGTFGSAFRDRAIILETLALLGNANADARALFEELSNSLAESRWLSTQETANALRAALIYMGPPEGGASQELSVEYSFAGQNQTARFTAPVTQVSLGSPAGRSGSFSARNRSAVPVYVRLSIRGLPEEGGEQPLSAGLSLAAEYRSASGAVITPAALKAGEDMTVRVTVTNNRPVAVQNIALVHQLPASWEIINERIGNIQETGRINIVKGGGSPVSAVFDYQDIRDDRVMTYFSLEPGASKTIAVRVNQTYGGSYLRPAIHAYAMYDESVAALIPGAR